MYAQQICLPNNNNINIINNNDITLCVVKVIIMTCCSSSVVLVIVVHLWNNLPEDVGTANLFALRISIIEILRANKLQAEWDY